MQEPGVVEFEPLVLTQLRRTAALTTLAGSLMLVALLGLGVAARRLSRSREALARELEREQHLGSLGQMSAVVAHEIRNPLTALKGHAQLLVKALEGGSRERAKAERVVAEAVRLETLTTDLLAFVRGGALDLRDVDPFALAQSVAAEVAAGRASVRAEGPRGLWPLDPDRMRQVLTNVIENAVHASPEGAPVDVVVTTTPTSLTIEVRDRGAGIRPGDEERVFEPFQTGKAHGTGLGLAVARRIVSLHGGGISAQSHPGGGALLRVTIPRS